MKLLFLSLASLVVVILSLGENVVTAARGVGRQGQSFKLKEACNFYCFDPDCPCPGSIQRTCLNSCGLDDCPCVEDIDPHKNFPNFGVFRDKRSAELMEEAPLMESRTLHGIVGNRLLESDERSFRDAEKARAIVTVNLKRFGPLCSGFLVLPNMALTTRNCLHGKAAHHLFVTVNLRRRTQVSRRLEVIRIHPFHGKKQIKVFDVPVFLELQTPGFKLDTLKINFNHFSIPCEIQKWEVSDNYLEYRTIKIRLEQLPVLCGPNNMYVCVNTTSIIRYGWNDIGTPIVDRGIRAFGIDIGLNLYKRGNELMFLSFKFFKHWLQETLVVASEH